MIFISPTALKVEVSRIFSLPAVQLHEDEKRAFHQLVTAAQPGNTFRTIWLTIRDFLETSHPEELQNFQEARQSVGELSLEFQQSILRHALGEPQPSLQVIRQSGEQCASSLEDSKEDSSSARSKKKRKVPTQEYEVDTEIQQLLKGVLGHLSTEALDKLKNELGAIPSEENSANESHGSDSGKYVKFLADFIILIHEDPGLTKGAGLDARNAFVETFQYNQATFYLMREALLNDDDDDGLIAARAAMEREYGEAHDGKTVATNSKLAD